MLQTGEFQRVGASRVRRGDVRVLSATNVDLPRAVADGTFREDLLFRVNTVEIQLPALRERREDVVPLATFFLRRYAAKLGRPRLEFTQDALQAMLDYPWPGNVRELEHAVERAALLATGDGVRTEDLRLRRPTSGPSLLEDLPLEEVERALIRKALARYAGNVSQAADALGLSRSALYRRLQKLGL